MMSTVAVLYSLSFLVPFVSKVHVHGRIDWTYSISYYNLITDLPLIYDETKIQFICHCNTECNYIEFGLWYKKKVLMVKNANNLRTNAFVNETSVHELFYCSSIKNATYRQELSTNETLSAFFIPYSICSSRTDKCNSYHLGDRFVGPHLCLQYISATLFHDGMLNKDQHSPEFAKVVEKRVKTFPYVCSVQKTYPIRISSNISAMLEGNELMPPLESTSPDICSDNLTAKFGMYSRVFRKQTPQFFNEIDWPSAEKMIARLTLGSTLFVGKTPYSFVYRCHKGDAGELTIVWPSKDEFKPKSSIQNFTCFGNVIEDNVNFGVRFPRNQSFVGRFEATVTHTGDPSYRYRTFGNFVYIGVDVVLEQFTLCDSSNNFIRNTLKCSIKGVFPTAVFTTFFELTTGHEILISKVNATDGIAYETSELEQEFMCTISVEYKSCGPMGSVWYTRSAGAKHTTNSYLCHECLEGEEEKFGATESCDDGEYGLYLHLVIAFGVLMFCCGLIFIGLYGYNRYKKIQTRDIS